MALLSIFAVFNNCRIAYFAMALMMLAACPPTVADMASFSIIDLCDVR